MEVIARANLGEQSNSEMPSLSKIVPLNPDLISNRVKQIWAVGGGKGGIGKSFLASSIAISLAKMGNTVIIVTHEEDIAQHAHRIIRLMDGKIHVDETNKKIKTIADYHFNEVPQ